MKFYPGDIVECIESLSFDAVDHARYIKYEVDQDNVDHFNNPKYNKHYKLFITRYTKPEGFK